jgi:hypothetical protein
MRAKTFWLAAFLVTMLTLAASAVTIGIQTTHQAPEAWMHVEVTGDAGENMNLHLPLATIEVTLALTPDTIVDNEQLRLGSDNEVRVVESDTNIKILINVR